MGNISIVTAFFDIGRGTWTPDKGLPHYLHRTNDTYFKNFKILASLNNEMVIFTTKDMVEKVQECRVGKEDITKIITIDYQDMFKEERLKIAEIQSNPEYRAKISPAQIKNPEYWSADYVLVNALKSTFINNAIDRGYNKTDLVAWVDFGYCRDIGTLYGVKEWNCSFDPNKIHLFKLKDYQEGRYISDIIFNNDVHMVGGAIIAGKDGWKKLEALVNHNINELLKNNLIDDDQTLLLMSYLSKKDEFELHPMTEALVLFRDYHTQNPTIPATM